MRAIRTDDFLLIHNYRPDRWPAGTPNYKQAYIPNCWIGDCDNGPTKTYMVNNREKDDLHRKLFDLSFGKRPEYELYDLKSDPQQINNVRDETNYADIQEQLIAQLKLKLISTNDPRETMDDPDTFFDDRKYFGIGPRHPSHGKKSN